MIAIVVFFTEGPVLEGVLVSDVWPAVVHEWMREIFARERAWLKDMEFVGSIWHGVEEGV